MAATLPGGLPASRIISTETLYETLQASETIVHGHTTTTYDDFMENENSLLRKPGSLGLMRAREETAAPAPAPGLARLSFGAPVRPILRQMDSDAEELKEEYERIRRSLYAADREASEVSARLSAAASSSGRRARLPHESTLAATSDHPPQTTWMSSLRSGVEYGRQRQPQLSHTEERRSTLPRTASAGSLPSHRQVAHGSPPFSAGAARTPFGATACGASPSLTPFAFGGVGAFRGGASGGGAGGGAGHATGHATHEEAPPSPSASPTLAAASPPRSTSPPRCSLERSSPPGAASGVGHGSTLGAVGGVHAGGGLGDAIARGGVAASREPVDVDALLASTRELVERGLWTRGLAVAKPRGLPSQIAAGCAPHVRGLMLAPSHVAPL